MINPLEIMKQAEELKSHIGEYKEKLAGIKCTGYAMGNMIEVVATGDMKVESIKIDPSLVKEGQEEMVGVLVASAVNSAFENVKMRIQEMAGQLGQQYGLSL